MKALLLVLALCSSMCASASPFGSTGGTGGVIGSTFAVDGTLSGLGSVGSPLSVVRVPAAGVDLSTVTTGLTAVGVATAALNGRADALGQSTMSFVLRAGDAMTGNLVVSSAAVKINGDAPMALQVGVSTFVVLGSGNVGIGTSAPEYNLDITPVTDKTRAMVIRGKLLLGDSDTELPTTLRTANDPILQIGKCATAGGGQYPNYGLAVCGGIFDNAVNSQLWLGNNSTMAGDKGGSIAFAAAYTNTAQLQFASIGGYKENSTGSNTAGYLRFGISKNDGTYSVTEAMRIDGNGYVGISTGSPAAMFDVRSTTGPTQAVVRVSSQNGVAMFQVLGNGKVNISTSAGGLEVMGSSITANAYFGNGSALSNLVVAAATAPVHSINLASISEVDVATVTATLRGGRPVMVTYTIDVLQALASARTHTLYFYDNNVLSDSHSVTTSGSGATAQISDIEITASGVAGTHTYFVSIKSDNATGTQTGSHARVNVVEY
jgi:hypothetical protein